MISEDTALTTADNLFPFFQKPVVDDFYLYSVIPGRVGYQLFIPSKLKQVRIAQDVVNDKLLIPSCTCNVGLILVNDKNIFNSLYST